MKRLQYFNLLGVAALAVLCAAQWQRDRQLNLEVNRLEKVRIGHVSQIAEQEQNTGGLNADLAQFKEQFTRTESRQDDARRKLQAAEREALQLRAERDQLRTSVTNWAAAVLARDERLKEADTHLSRLTEELNASVRKFNALATNHNAVVKDLNEWRARLVQPKSSGQ